MEARSESAGEHGERSRGESDPLEVLTVVGHADHTLHPVAPNPAVHGGDRPRPLAVDGDLDVSRSPADDAAPAGAHRIGECRGRAPMERKAAPGTVLV